MSYRRPSDRSCCSVLDTGGTTTTSSNGLENYRTPIFEGAYRAWCYMGILDPYDVLRQSSSDLLLQQQQSQQPIQQVVPDEFHFPYEPLPRSGINHSFIQVYVKNGKHVYPVSLWRHTNTHAKSLTLSHSVLVFLLIVVMVVV
jgi:hypothetical protein